MLLFQCPNSIILLLDQGVGLVHGGEVGDHDRVNLGMLYDQKSALKNIFLMILAAGIPRNEKWCYGYPLKEKSCGYHEAEKHYRWREAR